MTNALHVFNFHTAEVRVVPVEGEPWFVASDVAKVLGYANPTEAVADHCKAATETRTSNSLGRLSKTIIIPERDLYRLIMRSKLPAAEAFEEWVVGTVLPAIRKDGGYISGEEKVASGEMTEEELVLRAIQVQETKIARLKAENAKLSSDNDIMAPKAAVVDQHYGTNSPILHRFIRTLDGVNINATKRCLKAMGYLYQTASSYRVYRKYQHLFVEKADPCFGKIDIFVTDAGKQELVKLYTERRLVMKKGS